MMDIPIHDAAELPISTFNALPEGTAFQLIWTVPGPAPEPPAETIYTKIAPRQCRLGVANAVYPSGEPGFLHTIQVPSYWRVLRVDQRYAATIAEEEVVV
jgi:hypothetical protein